MVRFALLLILLNSAFATNCGYTSLSVSTSGILNVGEFTVSLNKCQAISAYIDVDVYGTEYAQNVNGGIIFSCSTTTADTLIIDIYDNPSCSGSPDTSYDIHKGNTVTLFSYFQFTVDELICSNTTSCGIDITIAEDCRGIDSNEYSHFSIPPNLCQTFGDDFYGPFHSIPYELIPQEAVDRLDTTSLNFKCCTDDNSLLIYNYSNTHCDAMTPYNLLRLPNKYNGECFVLGNQQDIFVASSNNAKGVDINNYDDVYALSFNWNCDDLSVDCTGINYMTDDQIPNICPDKCLKDGYIMPPTIPHTTSSTMSPTTTTSSKSSAIKPTKSWPTDSSVAPHKMSGNNKPLSAATPYVVVGISVLLVIVAVVVIGLFVMQKRRMAKAVKESENKQKANEEVVDDVRYEPMIQDDEGQDNTDNKKENVDVGENDNDINITGGDGQYVLPGAVTTVGDKVDSTDNVNLLADHGIDS